MTWDEALAELQRTCGGTLLGSTLPGCPSGLLHTRYQGVDITLSYSCKLMGNNVSHWILAAAPVELERPYNLAVKHRNKLAPQGLLADFEQCSTGRPELDEVLFAESDDPDFTKKVFLSPEFSRLLPSRKRYQFRVAPVAGSETLHVAEARTDRLSLFDGQLSSPNILTKPLTDEQLLDALEHLILLTAAGADALTRWRQ